MHYPFPQLPTQSVEKLVLIVYHSAGAVLHNWVHLHADLQHSKTRDDEI